MLHAYGVWRLYPPGSLPLAPGAYGCAASLSPSFAAVNDPLGALQVGTLEAIKVKILIMGDISNPLTLRIELTSENDLFFQ